MHFLTKQLLIPHLLIPFVAFFAYIIFAQVSPIQAQNIIVDGSSTVYPVVLAVSDLFQRHNPNISVQVDFSGTGAGFKKFAAGLSHINTASRRIKDTEADALYANGFDFEELQVGFDGITIVVHKSNSFAKDLSLAEILRIWKKGSDVVMWSDIRPTWPKEPISLYSPSHRHGTFDFFIEELGMEKKDIRTDYVMEDDYKKLTNHIIKDPNALGFITYAYYVQNFAQVNALPISNDADPIPPIYEHIVSGRYTFSRVLFLYINKAELAKPSMERFLTFFYMTVPTIIRKVGYIPLTKQGYVAEQEKVLRQVKNQRAIQSTTISAQ